MVETEGIKTGITLDDGGSEKYKFEDHYELQDRLSEGSFGTVYVAQHIRTKEDFAVKVIDRKKLSENDKNNVSREVGILRDCRDVKNIVRLVDFYVSPERFYVIQLYAEGGDVFERLASRTTYNEKVARDLALHLLEAMNVLHERKLAHRDLKPENLLLRSLLDDAEILVADFGFAKYVPEEGLTTRCGTPAFVAPEILVQDCRYDERVDMWSVGCLLYMLIGGYPPFQAPNHRALFRKVKGADFIFHDQYWKNVSVSAKQLIASLLTVDPRGRCTAKLALEKSNWLKIKDRYLEKTDLSASLGEIKKFRARNSLKGAIHTVMWSVKTKFKSADYIGFSQQIKDWDENDERATGLDGKLKTESRPTLKFDDAYELKEIIHKGKASSVWECQHKQTNENLAVKVVDRQQDPSYVAHGGRTVVETVLHEFAVLKSLNHGSILKFIDFFDQEDAYYLVMENMEGGDLFERIMQKQRYTEKDACGLAHFLLDAVAYMHSQGICHRDLKPQNLLLKRKDDDEDIKIAGFGFACRVHTPQSLTKRCGTPTYVAPEILKNIPYDESADMWSVGVILYVLLSGRPPFVDENQTSLFEKIRIGEYSFDGPEWLNVSEDAKDLIRHLLLVDPSRRWTAKQALQSKWLREDEGSLENIDLSMNLHEMRKRRTQKLKNVAKAIMWMNTLGDSVRGLDALEDVLSRKEANEDDPDASCMNFNFDPNAAN